MVLNAACTCCALQFNTGTRCAGQCSLGHYSLPHGIGNAPRMRRYQCHPRLACQTLALICLLWISCLSKSPMPLLGRTSVAGVCPKVHQFTVVVLSHNVPFFPFPPVTTSLSLSLSISLYSLLAAFCVSVLP